MSNLPALSSDQLLSFHDFPAVHRVPINQGIDDLTIEAPDLKPKVPLPDEPPNQGDETPSSTPFWTLEYYQAFFDVDTNDIKERILASLIPQSDSALKRYIKQKPDLYGPLWITLTLTFTTSFSGNIANYLEYSRGLNFPWNYDFGLLISIPTIAIYCYVLLVPLALCALLKWSSTPDLDDLEENNQPSTLELISIYGYSLFIYVPVSFFWAIPSELVQFTTATAAGLNSVSVLLFTLRPALRLSRYKRFIIFGIIVCHSLLVVGLCSR